MGTYHFGLAAISQTLPLVSGNLLVPYNYKLDVIRFNLKNEEEDKGVDKGVVVNEYRDQDGDEDKEDLKNLLISWVKWYKNTLSPIMPPNCRFFPSCSSYSVDSLEKYGPAKGLILTAWRIFRCNPAGGSGYDVSIDTL